MSSRGLFIVIALAGCRYDARKNHCATQNDCDQGYACTDGVCLSSQTVDTRRQATVSGVLQFAQPCILPGFTEGCARLITLDYPRGGTVKYIDRPELDNASSEVSVLARSNEKVIRFTLEGLAESALEVEVGERVQMDATFDEAGATIVALDHVVQLDASPFVHLSATARFVVPCYVPGFGNGCAQLVENGRVRRIDLADVTNANEFGVLERDAAGEVTFFSLRLSSGETIKIEDGQAFSADAIIHDQDEVITSLRAVTLGEVTPKTLTVRGKLAFEEPCARTAFASGCIRLDTQSYSKGGSEKYVDRPDWAEAAEWLVLEAGATGSAKLVRLYYGEGAVLDFVPGSSVEVHGKFDGAGTTLIEISDASLR